MWLWMWLQVKWHYRCKRTPTPIKIMQSRFLFDHATVTYGPISSNLSVTFTYTPIYIYIREGSNKKDKKVENVRMNDSYVNHWQTQKNFIWKSTFEPMFAYLFTNYPHKNAYVNPRFLTPMIHIWIIYSYGLSIFLPFWFEPPYII